MVRSALLALTLLLSGAAAPALGATGETGTAADAVSVGTVAISGDRDDYVSGGDPMLLRSDRDALAVSGSVEDVVTVRGASGAHQVELQFAAPRGQALTTGAYEDAVSVSFREEAQPGIATTIDRRTCSSNGSARFTVLDLAPDLSRLWIVFEERCQRGAAAHFGEVRIGQPADGQVQAAATRVEWPETYPGRAAASVPVTLINSGSTTVRLGAPAMAAGSDPDFRVISNACGSLAAGAACEIVMGFTPRQAGVRGGTLTVPLVGGGSVAVKLAGRGMAGVYAWRTETDPGYPGQPAAGSSAAYDPSTAVFYVRGDLSSAAAHIWTRDTRYLEASFAAPAGEILEAGRTYVDDDSPGGAQLAADGSFCPMTGSFTVHEIGTDAAGVVDRLSVTFAGRCINTTSDLRGSIAVRADRQAQPIPASTLVPAPTMQISAPARVKAGSRVDVVVRVARGTPGEMVTLRSAARGEDAAAVQRAPLSADGEAAFTRRVVTTTDLTATYSRGSETDATASDQATIASIAFVDAKMLRPDRRVRGVAIYTGGRAYALGPVQPSADGDCARFQFVVGTGKRAYRDTTSCRPIEQGYVSAFFPWSRTVLGVPQKVRIVYGGGAVSEGAASPWRRFEFRRR